MNAAGCVQKTQLNRTAYGVSIAFASIFSMGWQPELLNSGEAFAEPMNVTRELTRKISMAKKIPCRVDRFARDVFAWESLTPTRDSVRHPTTDNNRFRLDSRV